MTAWLSSDRRGGPGAARQADRYRLQAVVTAATSVKVDAVLIVGHHLRAPAVSTDSAPAALGPCQAIIANGFVFCSGTAGIDPATGAVAEDIEAQAEQALRDLGAILDAAGASLATLVKTTTSYQNVDDFAAINAVYAPLHARAASGPVVARQRQPATWPPYLYRRNRGLANDLALRITG
jgi:2-iminobutanoate/2-iminopropanoate deaminase